MLNTELHIASIFIEMGIAEAEFTELIEMGHKVPKTSIHAKLREFPAKIRQLVESNPLSRRRLQRPPVDLNVSHIFY